MSNSQLNKWKSGIKNGTEVTLNLSSNLIGNSSNETNFPNKLLLTETQISKIRQALKFSKTQLSKMIQSRGILGELLLALPYSALKAGTQN